MKKRLCLSLVLALIMAFYISAAVADEEPPIFPGYPMNFSETGYVDQVSNRSIVIEDRNYIYKNSTTFNTPMAKFTSKAVFKSGYKVGILLDESGLVDSVWLLKKK